MRSLVRARYVPPEPESADDYSRPQEEKSQSPVRRVRKVEVLTEFAQVFRQHDSREPKKRVRTEILPAQIIAADTQVNDQLVGDGDASAPVSCQFSDGAPCCPTL